MSIKRRLGIKVSFATVFLLTLAASAAEAQVVIAGKEHSSPVERPRLGLLSLPEPAQPVVSATLGREDAHYRVRRTAGALSADNPAQSLTVEFTRRGTELHAGQTHWRLGLARYGYGSVLERAHAADPQSGSNRVEYRRGPLLEWYVNGPLGLEQGFTLTAPPGRHRNQDQREPLTIALALSGDLSASPDSPAKRPGDTRTEGLTLRDRNGRPVLRYTGLAAHDANGQELVAWLELAQGELRLRVDDAKARYPVVVDPFVQRAKLTASDGAAHDEFGGSVATSSDGNTIVAGADGATIGSNILQGAAYVFVKPASGWTNATETAKLLASDGALGDLFGGSVAISSDGGTIVVGAPTSSSGQGAAYVFPKPSTGWTSGTETAKLAVPGSGELGNSLGISSDGSTVVAGAAATSTSINHNQGAAYIFVKPATGWASETAAAQLTASDAAGEAGLGESVALSSDGSTVVAGAPAIFTQDAAYVFVRPPSGWLNETETAKLTASDGVGFDVFGVSAGISGDGSTIVVGAPQQPTSGANTHQGAVYVFVKPAAGWTSGLETAKLLASDGAEFDHLGSSARISADGSTIASGAVRATIGSNALQGAAYLFVKPAAGWTTGTETFKLTASDGGASDFFGSSLALSDDAGTIVAAAAKATIGSNAGQGAAYVFLPAPLASPSPTSLSFGNQAAGTASSGQTVTLKNTGNAPLHVTSVAAGSGFSTTTNCVTASPLAIGASCMESVAFVPTTTGAVTGNLAFTDDSNGTAGSMQNVSLSGTGVKATTTTSIISAVPSPSVVGQPVTVSFSVSPPAGDTLTPSGTVTVSATTGENCVGSAPSGSCALTFLTAVPRTIAASYGGDANFLGSPSAGIAQTVQDFTLAAGPASQTISPGHQAIYSLTLTALDGLSGAVSLSCSGGPPGSTCLFSPNPAGLSGPASATVSLSGPKGMNHGTFMVTFKGTFGSGNPATGGLTHSASVSLTVK